MKLTPLFVLVFCATFARAQRPAVEADTQKTEPPPSVPTKWMKMDYGPFLTTSIVRRDKSKPNQKPEMVAYKGIAIKLPGAKPAAVVFDTDLMTLSAGWTGGYLDLLGSMMAHHKGTANAAIVGDEIFSWRSTPGWYRRTSLNPETLTEVVPRYKGLFVHGERVVLSYSIAGCSILEWVGVEEADGALAIARTFHVGKTDWTFSVNVAGDKFVNRPRASSTKDDGVSFSFPMSEGDRRLGVTLVGGLPNARWSRNADGIALDLPAFAGPTTFKILITHDGDGSSIERLKQASKPPVDLLALTKGGPLRWPQTLTTRGKCSADGKSAYVVDDLSVPEDNPWTSWMRTTGVDFFSDGRAAVCTFNGDVWVVSGIDDQLQNLTWKRYAAGLYEPLGIRVVDDLVHVRCRDQITRLHDLNTDGEADFYENVNNDDPVNPSYHGFCFELQTDRAGNFYYTRTGHRAAPGFLGHGLVHRISKDGKTHDVIASGLRAPNGLGVGPDDTLLVSDNQGNWVPSSKVHQIKLGDFVGYMPQHHRPEQPSDYAKPLAWIPTTLDSSSGSPIFVSSDKWGPLAGKWVHTSFGRATLSALLPETVDGEPQGAVVKLPLTFSTGIMRGRFHPIDGQLYLTGVGGGWQAGAPKDGGLYRVRYTGRPLLLPIGVTTEEQGLRVHFSVPLDKASASDDQNYALEQWNYLWSEAYGSPDFSVADPKKKGRDEVAIKSAKLSEDGKSVLLEVPDLQPVMQLSITMSIKSADGAAIECEVFKTLNRVPVKP